MLEMKGRASNMSAVSPPETPPRGKTLPTEVLHRIVSHALATYLADVIDGPHALNIANYSDARCSFEVSKVSRFAQSGADTRARRCTNARHARWP